MLEGARSGIGNGKDTLFWTGNWLDSGSKLIDQAVLNIDQIDISARVCDLVTEAGAWDLAKIQFHVTDESIKGVIGMLPPSEDRGEDSWVWGCESNEKFTIRSAYELITCPENPKPETAWDLVWKWVGPSRVQHFLWLVAHERLMTNLERKQRHISDNAYCPRCVTQKNQCCM
ncbi:Putative ribonuclease H protein At1g65750 [Linum perenne]